MKLNHNYLRCTRHVISSFWTALVYGCFYFCFTPLVVLPLAQGDDMHDFMRLHFRRLCTFLFNFFFISDGPCFVCDDERNVFLLFYTYIACYYYYFEILLIRCRLRCDVKCSLRSVGTPVMHFFV